ncbi:hypothetical protein DVH24_013868 [Malus domestica]|uniref:Disease resistance R13L4/SHOC-2-like LRR domain-containing protein n=1 Tax=Malus domestica TaxID=3750 RepID=A0A498JHY3_MALDO|nr:hypothetical protein DVH24_013868 [Malus domestica]
MAEAVVSMVIEGLKGGLIEEIAIFGRDQTKFVDKFAPTRNDHLRSLLFFVDPEYRFSNWKKKFLRSVVCNFKLLRVLKLEGILSYVELPSNIGNLVHLRFLSLRESHVRRLPSSLGNLVCLQTLDLRLYVGWGVKVPNVIWKMKELRHLYLPVSGYRGKLKLATLGNLQSLVNVAGADCDLTHLAELTNLRKMFIQGEVKNMEEMLKSTGITFNHLRSLSLFVGSEVIPMKMVLSCPHIYKLELEGRMRDESLEGLQYYQNLTKMSMSWTKLQLESLKILEKIPNLRMLWLNAGSLDKNVSSEVVVSEEGYPNLEFLSLGGMEELKSWSIEKGGMPNLCRLSIIECLELRAVPEGLQHVSTLKELTIIGMRREFCSRAGEGEDFYKIKHVPSVTIM